MAHLHIAHLVLDSSRVVMMATRRYRVCGRDHIREWTLLSRAIRRRENCTRSGHAFSFFLYVFPTMITVLTRGDILTFLRFNSDATTIDEDKCRHENSPGRNLGSC